MIKVPEISVFREKLPEDFVYILNAALLARAEWISKIDSTIQCLGRAATQVKEFYMLPVGDKLIEYDTLAVNTIVANNQGEVSSCDVPFSEDLTEFNYDYLQLTKRVAETCENHDITDSMVIGTSALTQYEIDGAVGMYGWRTCSPVPRPIAERNLSNLKKISVLMSPLDFEMCLTYEMSQRQPH